MRVAEKVKCASNHESGRLQHQLECTYLLKLHTCAPLHPPPQHNPGLFVSPAYTQQVADLSLLMQQQLAGDQQYLIWHGSNSATGAVRQLLYLLLNGMILPLVNETH